MGFMVSYRGIEANPEKVDAIINMKSPQIVKDIQWLMGRVEALSRFVLRSTDRCFPFFHLLKKGFEWTEEAEWSFQDFKGHLASLPTLRRTTPGEGLYLYLTVSDVAVSLVLIKDGHGQIPVYYTSRALHGVELRYLPLEKLAFALITTTRKLRPYFQFHQIVVLMNQPLKAVLQKPEVSGRSWRIS